ncbi:sugar transferase [Patescibacteria group bacterium]|nr:sugar transferase [Patescibacteria group bacterium]
MKRANFVVNIALVPIDFILVILAAVSAYFLRFSDNISEIRPVFYELPFSEFLDLALKVSLVSILVFAMSGFYTMRDKKLAKELPKIFSGVSTVGIIIILSIFWQRELFSSRFIIIFSWALTIVYLFLARIIIFSIRNYFLKKGYGHSNIIVLGSEESRNTLVDEYKKKPQLGFTVLGEFTNLSSLKQSLDIQEKIQNKKVDSIIQTDSSIGKTEALDLLTYAQENHISLKYVASLFQTQSLNLNIISLAGQPIIEIQGTPLDGWRRVYKRIFDCVMAIVLIIMLSPLLLILALIVKFSSSGPVIVRLQRVGVKGRSFSMYKFRSMIKGAEKMKKEILDLNERSDGPLFKIKDDPRITKFGKWLRRTSLDELPQLFNVLAGHMSLVGPRPHEPQEVDRYQRGYKKLLTIKPGITGMAQVSGRSNLPFTEEAKLDIFYIENWSVLLDLIILLKTPKAMFEGDRV